MVRVVVRPWRTRQEASSPALTPAQRARLSLQPAGRLTETARDTLEDVLEANPLLARGYWLKTWCQTRLAERDVGAFEPWLQQAEASDLPAFQTVAGSFRQDADAIIAALTTPWSPGPCEGQSGRVKLRKRLGSGRAKLDWLGQRILHRMVPPMTRPGRARPVQPPIAA
jgi:transposase